ncbi:hypothetical protein CDAR_295691 [Caerostris darwini]|uniref:Uncharacterized protein n=1 Tax=Caerostris darwini TaxID=1538125 RepID=A0AAV4NCX4_9ARAC|nr:hypothetical protein CDAR_295691 [Caerostris darwini]
MLFPWPRSAVRSGSVYRRRVGRDLLDTPTCFHSSGRRRGALMDKGPCGSLQVRLQGRVLTVASLGLNFFLLRPECSAIHFQLGRERGKK